MDRSRTPIARQLFEIPVAWEDRVLFSAAEGHLSYSETRARMLAAAAWLQQAHSVAPGDRVALCLPKNLGTVCLIFGVMAAAACMVPLQFNGPPERIRAQLASIRPHLFVTTRAMQRQLEVQPGHAPLPPTFCIDGPDVAAALERLIQGIAPLRRPVPPDPDALAGIYFTSGSTGEPKGIMLSVAGMAGTIAAFAAGDVISSDDRMLGVIALHYSSSLQMFYPLHGGSRMHLLADEDSMFPDLVVAVLRRERTTLWSSTATALRLLAEEASRGGAPLDAIRLVRFFGERMPMPALRAAMQIMPNAAFENVYGASEAFSMMTYRVPRPLPATLDLLPLGRPTGLYRQILCDADGNPVPEGEAGEVCVIGDTVMAGYWNDPELTEASRLPGVAHSFRTGDLARLGEDGNHHFVGRADHQIKLRGHRFDLGEIEAALKSHSCVRDAVAFVPADGPWHGRVLAAVLASREQTHVGELMALCARRLPTFARPAAIVVLDEFPQLSSGKVDRRALATLAAAPIVAKAESD
jgi:amino acid adenylation domain-containing protein